MKLQVGKALYQMLISDQDVVKAVGSKIYPLVADIETKFPFIVYKRNSIQPVTSKDKIIYHSIAYVEVVIASDKYEQSIEVAEYVISALKAGTFNGLQIKDIALENAEEDYQDNTFIQKLTIKICL